jgi:hypothetical protein
LRAEVAAAQGEGFDSFEFNMFDVELFYAEDRVRITDATALGYDDAELTMREFLAALPEVPAGPRMYGRRACTESRRPAGPALDRRCVLLPLARSCWPAMQQVESWRSSLKSRRHSAMSACGWRGRALL